MFLSNKAYFLYVHNNIKTVVSGVINSTGNRVFFTKQLSNYFLNRGKRKPLLVYHSNLVDKKIKSLSLIAHTSLIKFNFEYTKRVKLIVGGR